MLYPQAMNTLSTHDTKRSDDVRARLAVLTEIPGPWRAALRRWSRMNRLFKVGEFPDRNTEYFLYQTLDWRVADCERADPGLHGKGCARGQGADKLDPAKQGV